MDLKLYVTETPDNYLNKVLSSELVVPIVLKRDVDITSPVLMLKKISGVDFSIYNYAEIDVLKRSYFIRSVESVNNELFKLYLECDVLCTYKTDVLNSKAEFMGVIEVGDFGSTNLNFTGQIQVENHYSNVELELVDNSILSILKWG